MLTSDLLLTHLNYSEGALQRLLEAPSDLQPEELSRDHGTADKSVLGMLAPVLAADRHWLARVRGQEPELFIDESDYSLEVLRREWPAIHQGWRDWLATLSMEGIAGPIHYSDLKGRPYATPAWQIVLHVVNHGTHHRGQISRFLRRIGQRPRPLDLIAYYKGL